MTESDDPVTLGLVSATGGLTTAGAVTAGVVGAAGIGAATGAFSKSGAPKMPGAAVDNSKTATALPQTSEAAKKKRKLAASVMAKDFQAPTLGTPGLLGI